MTKIFKQGLSYKVLLILLLILIISGLIYLFKPLNLCQQADYDMSYFIKALEKNDTALCNKIKFRTEHKDLCITTISKNQEACNNQRLKNICLALVKNDATICGKSMMCNALIKRDVNYCYNMNIKDLNLTVENEDALKKLCTAYANLDADFFVSRTTCESKVA